MNMILTYWQWIALLTVGCSQWVFWAWLFYIVNKRNQYLKDIAKHNYGLISGNMGELIYPTDHWVDMDGLHEFLTVLSYRLKRRLRKAMK